MSTIKVLRPFSCAYGNHLIMIKEGRGSGSYLKISWYDTSVLVAIKGMKSDVYGQKLNYEL